MEANAHDQEQDASNHYGENHPVQQAGYFHGTLLLHQTRIVGCLIRARAAEVCGISIETDQLQDSNHNE
jgi:hypothetical protein